MDPTSEGRFRVLDRRAERGELLLVEATDDEAAAERPEDAYAPTYVADDGYEGELAAAVDDLRPGHLVDATLSWRDGTAQFESVSVVERTRFEFADDVTGLFEAATEAWRHAEANNEGMATQVTRDTDGEPNGVFYLFAKQPARDLFAEFQNGSLPLEPLLARANADLDDDDPREVFVMRPRDEPFVVVYIAFRRDGLLANTVRDTYDLPRE